MVEKSVGHTYVEATIRPAGSKNGVGFTNDFLVDTGATDSLVPASALVEIGIEPVGRDACELADGTVHTFDFGAARIEILGQVTFGRVFFGPEGAEPILGVTALESGGFIVDPRGRRLIRRSAVLMK